MRAVQVRANNRITTEHPSIKRFLKRDTMVRDAASLCPRVLVCVCVRARVRARECVGACAIARARLVRRPHGRKQRKDKTSDDRRRIETSGDYIFSSPPPTTPSHGEDLSQTSRSTTRHSTVEEPPSAARRGRSVLPTAYSIRAAELS